MKSQPVLMLLAVMFLSGSATAQVSPCPLSESWTTRERAGVLMTPAEAAVVANHLMASINSDPQGPCSLNYRRLAVRLLQSTGREAEALEVALAGVRLETNEIGRALLANCALSIYKQQSNNGLDPETLQKCRDVALEALAPAPTPRQRLDRREFGPLSFEIVLHHVVVATDPDTAARRARLNELIHICEESQNAAAISGVRFDMDIAALYEQLSFEILPKDAVSVPADELATIATDFAAVVRRSNLPESAASMRARFLRHPALSGAVKLAFEGLTADMFGPRSSLLARWSLLKPEIVAVGSTTPVEESRRVLGHLDLLWHEAMAIEDPAPVARILITQDDDKLWKSALKEVLFQRVRLGIAVLGDCEYATVAAEYLSRWPEESGGSVERMLHKHCP